MHFAEAMELHDGDEQLAACLSQDDEDLQFQTVLVVLRASLLCGAGATPGAEELDERSIRTRVFDEAAKRRRAGSEPAPPEAIR
eukprot:SAG11_NODE_4_length_33019_cov_28.098909_30_plen_84_part_00